MSVPRPYYHALAWAYDLLQTDPVAPRIDFIEEVLSGQGIAAGARVLDAGCGTGRYAVELAKRGFRVLGVDRSAELIAMAEKREQADTNRAEFLIADLLDVSFSHPFDAVLCRGVLNDFVDDDARKSIFLQFARWLQPGGVLILDVRDWTRTADRYAKDSIHSQLVELPDGILQFRSETAMDIESHRMQIRERFDLQRGGVRTTSENDFVMRCWTPEEVAACLNGAGLQQVVAFPGYGTSGRIWPDRLVVVARR
ncbi:MAG TPA: class I SAM-dependent methyltransferase [Bryobacteraceae bacterium]|nr:class I SAM-dependent methyltransferase [Bryobacteraceae bacterium]